MHCASASTNHLLVRAREFAKCTWFPFVHIVHKSIGKILKYSTETNKLRVNMLWVCLPNDNVMHEFFILPKTDAISLGFLQWDGGCVNGGVLFQSRCIRKLFSLLWLIDPSLVTIWSSCKRPFVGHIESHKRRENVSFLIDCQKIYWIPADK